MSLKFWNPDEQTLIRLVHAPQLQTHFFFRVLKNRTVRSCHEACCGSDLKHFLVLIDPDVQEFQVVRLCKTHAATVNRQPLSPEEALAYEVMLR